MSTRQARRLRRHATEAEKKLWLALRNRQVANAKFRRQVPVGPYVCDFLCVEAKLIVEVDGGQHNETVDEYRSKQLANRGFRILRFWNNDVMKNFDGVLTTIADTLERRSRPPHPTLSPKGGEGIYWQRDSLYRLREREGPVALAMGG